MAVTSTNVKLSAAQKRRLRFDQAVAAAPDERHRRWAVTQWWLSECRKLAHEQPVAELARMVAFVAALNEGRTDDRTAVTRCECQRAMPSDDATAQGGFSAGIREARVAQAQRNTTGIVVTERDGGV